MLLVITALPWWMPVCGPIPEWRQSLPAQMVYLFLMSVVPTVPGAWLTFADGAVYKVYDIPQRMWGISVTQDQQAAGLIMKLGGGAYLWTLITMLFFRWAARHEEAERLGRIVTERDVLTWQTRGRRVRAARPGPGRAPQAGRKRQAGDGRPAPEVRRLERSPCRLACRGGGLSGDRSGDGAGDRTTATRSGRRFVR